MILPVPEQRRCREMRPPFQQQPAQAGQRRLFLLSADIERSARSVRRGVHCPWTADSTHAESRNIWRRCCPEWRRRSRDCPTPRREPYLRRNSPLAKVRKHPALVRICGRQDEGRLFPGRRRLGAGDGLVPARGIRAPVGAQRSGSQSGLCDDAGHGRQEGNPPLPGSACRRTPGGR